MPELKHGQFVELEGEITRATESTNTIGFRYQDHILVCKPDRGGIIANFKANMVSQRKDHFFPKIKLVGVVDRTDELGGFKEKKPQIIFSKIIALENKDKDSDLFGK